MIETVLIANRGAIAVRIARTLDAMGKRSIAIYAEDDIDSAHIDAASEAHCLGGGPVGETYLNQDRIFEIAKATGTDAIHPGYGFLSENASFEARCAAEGIAFLGPTAEQIRLFGLKHSARELAVANEVPLLPGSDLVLTAADAIREAELIGYPVILKSTAGGGGIGMRRCNDAAELEAAFDGVRRLAEGNFGDAGVFLERYVLRARHVEVQVIGDGEGNVLTIGDRDCSLQRRQQKVVEECPAPNLPDAVRAQLAASARKLLAAVAYRGVGTVEFVYDEEREEAYFLEVNTRLQVEHGVTEMVFGVDLVDWMVRLAEGTLSPLELLAKSLEPSGHAMQARVYAEDSALDFRPAPGLLTEVSFPVGDGIRIDTWVAAGSQVSPNFDPMIAKVIVHADDRERAREGLIGALSQTRLYGTETNLDYLQAVIAHPDFVAADLRTSLLAEFSPPSRTIRVLSGGTMTTLQDFPGRVGYWHVGVPPSGPFDDLSFRIGNRLLGNQESATGLEMTVQGPTLEFSSVTRFVLTGANMQAMLDGEPVETGVVVEAPATSQLVVGQVQGNGLRGYLLIEGGFKCPDYLDSASTFTLGQFGGHCGRSLRAGDVLRAGEHDSGAIAGRHALLPPLQGGDHVWTLPVIYGPHGAPDFFTAADIETLFDTTWEIHFNSSRTGVRLIGPKPEWAREDGGEAGLHPSNIHDNAYAIGTIDFTGDMPVILGPDGPSLGGFVCPATVIRADRWKLGQLRPGDRVQFLPVTEQQAIARRAAIDEWIASDAMTPAPFQLPAPAPVTSAVIDCAQSVADPTRELVFRPSGDDYLLVELGEQVLDLAIRFHIHALYEAMEAERLPGMLEMTPGIRSLQIHFVPETVSRAGLIDFVKRADRALGDIEQIEVPARRVYLPLSFDDPACQEAIDKYQRVVRPDAPWCPSNLEFIRRINGLDSIDQVRETVFDARYVVLGLGDVYLGAPVATPLDPRQRLVTTKYNPARTWTAENSVGIGGAYLCIYGMEGPGGYQFVGRTLQVWNRYRKTPVFEQPWLLRFFDQIQFYPVSADELPRLREQFIRGRFTPRIEETTFSLAAHRKFVAGIETEVTTFRERRQSAFREELGRWREQGLLSFEETAHDAADAVDEDIPPGCVAVESQVSGNVWQLKSAVGDVLAADSVLLVLESMKMELDVMTSTAGRVRQLLVEPGQQVTTGQRLAIVEVDSV